MMARNNTNDSISSGRCARPSVARSRIMTDQVAEAIKHRHPKEWVFFWLTALLTVAVLLILLRN